MEGDRPVTLIEPGDPDVRHSAWAQRVDRGGGETVASRDASGLMDNPLADSASRISEPRTILGNCLMKTAKSTTLKRSGTSSACGGISTRWRERDAHRDSLRGLTWPKTQNRNPPSP